MKKLTKKAVNNILDGLDKLYPEAECALDFGSVFQLLVSVVLSAQTTDKSVNVVTEDLFRDYPDALALSQISEEELQQRLKRVGMYKTKAKNVLRLSQLVWEKYGGAVPQDYDALLELPGVGRKTANVVLSVGFGEQHIAVDTHVFRVANRIGLADETDVLKTELALMETIPEMRWTNTHHTLIWHGRRCCHARKPECESCGIEEWCLKRIKDK